MGGVSFLTQANALLRKDLTNQKRNMSTNLRLILFPIIILLLLRGIQFYIDKNVNNKCEENGDGQCKPRCGSGSPLSQNPECAIPNPPEWLPLVDTPKPDFRFPYGNLPNDSCREARSCPVSVLITGANKSAGEILSKNMFPSSFIQPPNDTSFDMIADNVLGTQNLPDLPNYRDPGFVGASTIYSIQSQCVPRPAFSGHLPKQIAELGNDTKVECLQGLPLWRNSSSEVNDELYKGYGKGNLDGNINEILAGYDFLNTNRKVFNMSIWFNRTQEIMDDMTPRLRVPRLVNLISNAFLQYLLGPGTKMRFLFTKEMPKAEFPPEIFDITSNFGLLFFVWIILQLFPVMLTSLVYEKQHKLRLMMKMHGLGDRAYWMSSYANFLIICSLYMVFFVATGAVVGLNFFRLNDCRVQAVFYFLFINLLIASAFLAANVFSNTRTATVVAYLGIFATGFVGYFFFLKLVDSSEVPRILLIVLELYPGFSLFRGLYEFGQALVSGDGIQWSHLHDSKNEMRKLLILISVEWLVLLVIAFCLDQFASSSGGGKLSSFLLRKFCKKDQSSIRTPSQESNVSIDMEKPDVTQERLKVSQSLLERNSSHAIVCDDLKKVYPGMDGNPDKFAVRGLSLAIPKGECFGMLGPNGAGKTSFISMMIGLSKPTAGTAYVEGLDIKTDMPSVHACMGVCPQFDILWETLTGREHLLFYARLKNLTGSTLTEAVEESLKGVNLYNGGLADRPAGKYSGGMKRRLSVAISLVGDPKVVYMDEPSTGLDPVSRNYLWDVVKRAKNDRAIILTTHSMEEAEVLCDRLGIFSDGRLQCIGYPKELKSRYGGSYVFTLTTSSKHEGDVEKLVQSLFPNAIKVYHLSGTQKFELPKSEVKIAHVFQAVEKAKSKFQVTAWGVADTTLEDVFIKVVRGITASRSSSLS